MKSGVEHEMPAIVTGYSVEGRERSYQVTPIDQDAYLPKGTVVTVFTAAVLAAYDARTADVRREANTKALAEMADESAALDDGGKRGLAGNAKSSASAITHRHSLDVVHARIAAYREEAEDV